MRRGPWRLEHHECECLRAAAGRGSRRRWGAAWRSCRPHRSACATAMRTIPYRFDSYFYYLTGFREPEAVLVVVAGREAAKSMLFCRERDPEREIWDGFRYGPEAAREAFGFDEAHSIAQLDELVPGSARRLRRRVLPSGRRQRAGTRASMGWVNEVRAQARRGVAAPRRAEGRARAARRDAPRQGRRKSSTLMRRAADDLRRRRTGARCARRARDAASSRSRRSSCTSSAATARRRPPIPRSSRRARMPACCTTSRTAAMLKDGELLLDRRRLRARRLRLGHHAHLPRERPLQRAAARRLRARARRAGRGDRRGQARQRRGRRRTTPRSGRLAQGLIDLKLLAGSVDEVLETRNLQAVLHAPHRATGWGSTCTTPATTSATAQWRKLEPGMVLTVEPGCYIRAAERRAAASSRASACASRTTCSSPRSGNEVLTRDAPKTIADIEALMARARDELTTMSLIAGWRAGRRRPGARPARHRAQASACSRRGRAETASERPAPARALARQPPDTGASRGVAGARRPPRRSRESTFAARRLRPRRCSTRPKRGCRRWAMSSTTRGSPPLVAAVAARRMVRLPRGHRAGEVSARRRCGGRRSRNGAGHATLHRHACSSSRMAEWRRR